MTISSTTNRAQFNCNGSTTSFPFTFKYVEASDLQVYLHNTVTGAMTLLTLNVDYEITPAIPGPGGTLSFLGTYLSSPPVSGYTLTILRFIARTQEVDFINGDSLDENNIEGMGDKLTMMVQDLDERIGRAVTVPPSSGISNISVPDPVAGAFLRWNLSGDGLENATNFTARTITPETTGTYDLGSASKKWANVHADKLYVTAIESNFTARTITPETTGTYDLGSASKKWANVHADQITLGGVGKTVWPSAVAGSNGAVIQSGAITLLGQDGVTVTHNHGSTSYLVKTNVTGLGNLGRIGDIAYVKAANTVVIYNSGISGISADVEISAVA